MNIPYTTKHTHIHFLHINYVAWTNCLVYTALKHFFCTERATTTTTVIIVIAFVYVPLTDTQNTKHNSHLIVLNIKVKIKIINFVETITKHRMGDWCVHCADTTKCNTTTTLFSVCFRPSFYSRRERQDQTRASNCTDTNAIINVIALNELMREIMKSFVGD